MGSGRAQKCREVLDAAKEHYMLTGSWPTVEPGERLMLDVIKQHHTQTGDWPTVEQILARTGP